MSSIFFELLVKPAEKTRVSGKKSVMHRKKRLRGG
jgi:hypothetical protein